MAQLATKTIEPKLAVPAAAIDRAQLARMTFGDRSLEREVLQLFDRQAVLLLARMHAGEPAVIGPLAHTLRGSAASIGAENVVRAAQAVELAAGPADRDGALDGLAMAIDQARMAIADILAAH